MAQNDKDRYQKELAVRFCLSKKDLPCLEVNINSHSDISDTTELLTDIDVLGISHDSDGVLFRTIYDCKSGKMSAINRAFWASGLKSYTSCDDAFVILKSSPVKNHRFSALQIGVDLHDVSSFTELGKTFSQDFNLDLHYQSSIDRWDKLYACWTKNAWSTKLFECVHSEAPLTKSAERTFRKVISLLIGAKGQFDPNKIEHVSIYLDTLCAAFIVWTTIGRDLRRIYTANMPKDEFENSFKYYIWGGKEFYRLRNSLKPKDENDQEDLEMPSWSKLVHLAGIIISSSQDVFACAAICRELAIRTICGPNNDHDRALKKQINDNPRAMQFIMAMNSYIIDATGIPKDMAKKVDSLLSMS